MVDDLIERVARAMCIVTAGTDGGAADPDLWRVYRDHAVAAIEALRQPTKAMVEAGAAAGDVGSYTAHVIFYAMINAALAPNRT